MSFNFNDLPEIYQIETTNACQLDCYMCPRKLMKRDIGYLDPKLVEIMVERGEFKNSYLVELQMYGEPLLHPDLDKIIEILKEKTDVKVGFSTNGLLLHEELDIILMCDYITVSLDADNPKTYISIRGMSEKHLFSPYYKLVSDLKELLALKDRPIVDIQLIDLPENKDQLKNIQKQYGNYSNVIIRTVQDCMTNMFNKTNAYPYHHELCLNPWLSVSIHWDGDVVACCFWFDKYLDNAKKEKFIYGNLYDEPLSKIWQGELVKEFRKLHLKNQLFERCKQCSARSPALLHIQMVMNWLKELKK